MKIITEIGLNHGGNPIVAKKILQKLINASTDGITFQIKKKSFYLQLEKAHRNKDKNYFNEFREKNFYNHIFLKKKFKSLSLNKEFYKDVIKFTKKRNKLIGFAVGDIDMVRYLSAKGADFFKILSEDLDNLKLIKEAIKSKVKIIFLSTGLHSTKKVKKLLEKIDTQKIVLLHTKFEHSIKKNNLKKIISLKKATSLPVGFGNHSKNKNIFRVVKNYQPSAIFFYVKSNFFKFHPDDSHAIDLKHIESLCKKLR